MKLVLPSTILVAVSFLLSACSNDITSPSDPSVKDLPEIPSSPGLPNGEELKQIPAPVSAPVTPSPANPLPAPSITAEEAPITDAKRATILWDKIQAYKTWKNPPGFEGLLESDTVHGDYVRFYANGIALTEMKDLPNGSIVVKEGFDDDEGDLNAITVMEKIDGFSEESGDWFFSRYDTAGKASKVNSNSCIRCHKKADGGDFSFAND